MIGAAVTSALTPPPTEAAGTLGGIEGRMLSITGVPDLAAMVVSGLLRNIPKKGCINPVFFRFSTSYCMRARATWSGSGTGISMAFSLRLASSVSPLKG